MGKIGEVIRLHEIPVPRRVPEAIPVEDDDREQEEQPRVRVRPADATAASGGSSA